MKTLKIIDVIIQASLVIFFVVKALRNYEDITETLIPAYFVIGGYQLTSCLLQLPYRSGRKQPPPRLLYQKTLIYVAIAGVIMIPIFLIFLMLLLFVAPVLAVLYLGLSIDETLKLMGYEK